MLSLFEDASAADAPSVHEDEPQGEPQDNVDDEINTQRDDEEVHDSQAATNEDRASDLSLEFANDPTLSPVTYDNLSFSDSEANL